MSGFSLVADEGSSIRFRRKPRGKRGGRRHKKKGETDTTGRSYAEVVRPALFAGSVEEFRAFRSHTDEFLARQLCDGSFFDAESKEMVVRILESRAARYDGACRGIGFVAQASH